jgi:hypothetical protein
VVGFACTAFCHYPRQKNWHLWERNYQAAIDTVLQQNALDFFLESPQLEGNTFSCILLKPSHAVHLASRLQVLAKHVDLHVGVGRGVADSDQHRGPFTAPRSAQLRAQQALDTATRRRPTTEAIFNGFGRWDLVASHGLSLTLAVRASWTGRQHVVVKLVEPIGSSREAVITLRKARQTLSSVYRRSHHAQVQALELELGNLLDAHHAYKEIE